MGHQLSWKDHLQFHCHTVCMDGWRLLFNQKGKPSHEWNFCKTWYMRIVVDTSTTYHVACRHRMCIFNTSFAYLLWLANNNKGKYPEFCMGYSDKTCHMVCHHQMHIFNTSFAYLFWLANNKKGKYPEFCTWTTVTKFGMWVVVGRITTDMVCHHQMRIFNTSYAYLFWLANNKKANNQSSV